MEVCHDPLAVAVGFLRICSHFCQELVNTLWAFAVFGSPEVVDQASNTEAANAAALEAEPNRSLRMGHKEVNLMETEQLLLVYLVGVELNGV